MLNVLRLQSGTQIDLFDAGGEAFSAQVVGRRGERAAVRLLAAIDTDATATSRINLAVSILKRRAMDWMIEKLSELGVDSLQPLLTQRCVAAPDIMPLGDPPPRWDRLALAAAKQCGRNQPLQIMAPDRLEAWLERPRPPAHTVFAHQDADAKPLAQWLTERSSVALPMWIAIGPEGGWTPEEVDALNAAGFKPVSLNILTLRAETAAIAAAAASRMFRPES